MRAMLGVVLPELARLPLEISRGPEQQAIQAFEEVIADLDAEMEAAATVEGPVIAGVTT